MTNSIIHTLSVSSLTSFTVTDNFRHLIIGKDEEKYTISLHIIPSSQGLNSCQRLLDPSPFQRPGAAVKGGGGYLCSTVSRTPKPPG